MNFGRIARERLQELRLRPAELARRTGYSQQYISDLLAGHRRWNETSMSKVCVALDIRVESTSGRDAQATAS